MVSGGLRRKILILAKSEILPDGAWFPWGAPGGRPTLWLSQMGSKKGLKKALFWAFFRLRRKKGLKLYRERPFGPFLI